jgi:hypothetical protein
MDSNYANKIIKDQLKICESLLCSKAKEYSLEKDRLASFKTGAKLQGITPKQCLLGYATKHIVSITDMIKTDKKFTLARWEEKITDTINYLLLLKAMVEEELLVEGGVDAKYSC